MRKYWVSAIVLFTSQLSSCAFIERQYFKSAGDEMRVHPLFRTEECKTYQPVDRNNYFAFRDPIFINECEDQIDSININNTPQNQNTKVAAPMAPAPAPAAQTPATPPDSDFASYCEKNDFQSTSTACAIYLIRKSDYICEKHLSHIFGTQTVTNATLDTLMAGTAIAGAAASGIAPNVLSGVTGLFNGIKIALNDDIYKKALSDAIIREILSNRIDFKNKIYNCYVNSGKPKCEPELKFDDYNGRLQQLLLMATEYHSQCSFYTGLSSLLGKAGKSNECKDKPTNKPD